MKEYLRIAELGNDPSDRLYIEDLKLSIAMFEKYEPKIMSGFEEEFC
jgi:hypothetical protein